MSFIGKFLGNVMGSTRAAEGALKAGETQAAAAQKGIDQVLNQGNFGQSILLGQEHAAANALRDYFNTARGAQEAGLQTVQGLAQPLIDTGTSAMNQQLALSGGAGPDAQRAAIMALQSSPEFAALTQQGENAILQNASATGGLRGGNTQAALAQFRPAMLSQLIEQQYGRLGGLSNLGMAGRQFAGGAALQTGQGLSQGALQTGQGLSGSALQTGTVGAGLAASTGESIAQLLQQQGAAIAGGQLAAGSARRDSVSDIAKIGATIAKMYSGGG